MVRSFNHWLSTIPDKLKIKAQKFYYLDNPTQQSVNYVAISNFLTKTEDLNPLPEEIAHWVKTHQIEKSVLDN